MLGIEEYQRLNSDKIEFLRHLLATGAASEELLDQASALLESVHGPFVAVFGQLPFRLDGGTTSFPVPGWRAGVTVQLRLQPVAAEFEANGNLTLLGNGEAGSANAIARVEFTQVVALIRLWSKRARLHASYLNYLTPTGVRKEVIGRIEDWMNLPEASLPMPSRRYAPLTAAAFEGEVAKRLRSEVLRALSSFLRAYSLTNLENVRWDESLYGYFAMTSPGRIANGGAPLPIGVGLAKRATDRHMAAPTLDGIGKVLGKVHMAAGDRVLRQLIAMNDLLQRGEPELAVVGCTSTVEYFLNDAFPILVTKKNGRLEASSLYVCSKHPALSFLSQDWKDWLKSLAFVRNPLIHGSVPEGRERHQRQASIGDDFVRDSLAKALSLYRLINVHTGRTYAPPPESPAPLDD